MTDADFAHCRETLRELDYDRYLASLYLPEPVRNAAFALYAFDAEIARVPRLVSEPMPGEIRLQWWRDLLADTSVGEPTNNPLADALIETISTHALPRATLDHYLQARIFDLYHDPMPDIATLEGYCGETASALFQLIAIAAGFGSNKAVPEICGHAGMVRALSAIIRQLPQHRRTKRIYLPLDLLHAAGLDAAEWLAQEPDARHLQAVDHVIALAVEHLEQVRTLLRGCDARLFPVFLPLAPASAYLSAAREQNMKLFDVSPKISPLRKHWILWRAMRRGTV